jgi:hypothetical protein
MTWAYLPVGPIERQFREGIQGGVWEEVHKWTLKKELKPFLGGTIWGSLC